MSPDVVALAGSKAEQSPHIDLLPGQVQAVMALIRMQSQHWHMASTIICASPIC